MKNNYLIVSTDTFNIQYNIDKIINKIKEDYEIIKYTSIDDEVEKVLEELDTYSLLNMTKVVIYYDFQFNDEEKLLKYLENPSDNYLILVADSNKKTKISSLLNLVDYEASSEDLIRDNLNEYNMDKDTIKYFAIHCLNNNEKILNELNKLKIIVNDKTITKKDIVDNVVRDYEDDVFALPNAISKKNKEEAINIYNRLSKKEKEPLKIIGTISHQIRTLYIVKVLSKTKSVQEIADITGMKTYPINLAINNSEYFTERELLDLIDQLCDIDIKSRSGYGSVDLLFELFIMGL